MSNSSYLFGIDSVSGWDARYFFTYYSEFDHGRNGKSIEVTILVCILILSVLTNVAVAITLITYPGLRTINTYFLLSLTAADLVFVAGIPALIYTRLIMEWTLGNVICKLLPYSQFVCSFVLLWTLAFISMDRYRCIVIPPFRSQLTPKRSTILILFIWLIAFLLFLPVVFWFRVQQVIDDHQICTLIFPRNHHLNISLVFTVVTLLFACFAPLTLFVYHYQRIFRKLNEMRDRWTQCDKNNKFTSIQPDVLRQKEELRFNRHVRVIRILLLNVIVVLVMWLPITLIMFLIYWDGCRPTEDTHFFLRSHHFIWALLVALMNTIVNPILYGVLSENFRKCFCQMWFFGEKRRMMCRNMYNGSTAIGSRIPSFEKTHMHFTNSIPIID